MSWYPPGPVKISDEKDGRWRQQHSFYVSKSPSATRRLDPLLVGESRSSLCRSAATLFGSEVVSIIFQIILHWYQQHVCIDALSLCVRHVVRRWFVCIGADT